MKELEKVQRQIPEKLKAIAKGATLRAVEKAADMTPPSGDSGLSGTHTRTGAMQQHWQSDSVTEPRQQGKDYVTELNNDMDYAPYVDEGHRMDRHFVPGLYVNGAGELEYDPSAKVGLVVGTKTPYVPGLHMVDAAKKEYERVSEMELRKLGDMLK